MPTLPDEGQRLYQHWRDLTQQQDDWTTYRTERKFGTFLVPH